LDAYRASFILPVELTIDTNKVHSIKALLDCGATSSFIDKNFICTKGINTQNISYSILVFNMDRFPNKAGQISEVVNIILQYNFHSEWMLLVVSSLGKQNLILGYSWLKNCNPEVDW